MVATKHKKWLYALGGFFVGTFFGGGILGKARGLIG